VESKREANVLIGQLHFGLHYAQNMMLETINLSVPFFVRKALVTLSIQGIISKYSNEN
jgi:hypothetical protein